MLSRSDRSSPHSAQLGEKESLSAGSGALLEVRNLGKRMRSREGRALEVLRDLSFDVREREVVSVVGPSGVGKTTLMRLIAGLMPQSSGNVRFMGAAVSDVPTSVSMVFQDYHKSLFPWLTVEKNARMGARALPKESAKAAVEYALSRVGIKGFGKHYPWELSGGMQQRVALARAMVSDPKLLLMDEPFASVDALTRSHLEDVLLDLWEAGEFACVLVTHDVGEAVYLSDRIVVLSARPAHVLAEVDVDLPRPRHQRDTRLLPRFAELQAEVLDYVSHAGKIVMGGRAEG